MFSEELSRYKESRTLVEICTDEQDTSRFNVGYIVVFDDEFFVMLTVSKSGRLDGFLLQKTEDIIRISQNTLYMQKLSTLMRYHNEKQESLFIDQYPVFNMLEYCRANNRIASIEICDSDSIDIRGYVDELDIDKCSIRQISEEGKYDGVTSILLKDISRISCASEFDVMLEILNSELFDEMHSS